MRNTYIALFAASAVITLVVITTVSLCYAVPCTTGSQVCDFVIDATHRCKNGVGTNSIMPNENTAGKKFFRIMSNFQSCSTPPMSIRRLVIYSESIFGRFLIGV
jgi:hypothetical protein